MKLSTILENEYAGLEDADEFSDNSMLDVTNGIAAEYFRTLPAHAAASVILVHPDSNAQQYAYLTLNSNNELIVNMG